MATSYREATPGTDTQLRFDEVTPFTGALDALGFKRLMHVTVVGSREATAVWHSREGDAVAEPEWMPGHKPLLMFRTLLEDGAIIQTGGLREGWIRHAPFWPRQHHPRAGYFMEERAGMPHELWARHQERVAEVCAQRGTKPVDHTGRETFLDLAQRAVRLAGKRTRVAFLAGLATLIASVVPLSLNRGRFADWAMAGMVLVFFAVMGAVFRLTLKLPWPKPTPASRP